MAERSRGERLLQQFARYPEPGRVKSRLMGELTPAEACAVHEALMTGTLHTLLGAELGPVQLWLDHLERHPLIDELCSAGALGPYQQRGADLGERMYQALSGGLRDYKAVVLVGSDCPGIDARYLLEAFTALESVDLVIGPAEDGGYVLIGCRRLEPQLFRDVSWGTDTVLRETLARAVESALSWKLLSPLYDVDRPEDLARWRDMVRGEGSA